MYDNFDHWILLLTCFFCRVRVIRKFENPEVVLKLTIEKHKFWKPRDDWLINSFKQLDKMIYTINRLPLQWSLGGPMVSSSACHAGDQGSIPRRGWVFFSLFSKVLWGVEVLIPTDFISGTFKTYLIKMIHAVWRTLFVGYFCDLLYSSSCYQRW